MVVPPLAVPEEFPTEQAQENERLRLFALIGALVQWENTTNEEALFKPEKLPGSYDPFAGGGALPFEAQWLGLVAHASDLNPVAVLINRAMIEAQSSISRSASMAGSIPSSTRQIALIDEPTHCCRTDGRASGLIIDIHHDIDVRIRDPTVCQIVRRGTE